MVSTVPTRLPTADGARHTVVVPLDVPLSGAHRRDYPLTVTAVSVLPQPEVRPARLDLEVSRVGARGAADTWGGPGLPAGAGLGRRHGPRGRGHRGRVPKKAHRRLGPGTPGVCSVAPAGSGILRTTISTGIRASQATDDVMGGLSTEDYDTRPTSRVRWWRARPARRHRCRCAPTPRR
ncbi:hypothetical protein SCYAM73S_05503 [Streptomyces cyaneofuscatus]